MRAEVRAAALGLVLVVGLRPNSAPAGAQSAPATAPAPATVAALATAPAPATAPSAATARAPGQVSAETLLASLAPEDRVGQLFLVAFYGTDLGAESDIADLIRSARLGGVVLQASSGNLLNGPGGGPVKVLADTDSLQAVARGPGGNGIPLFVAVDHEGDAEPLTHLRFGFTPIPSAMAIGATWSPETAEAVGRVVGRELAAAGVNMLLGPVLDVLSEPRTSQRGDIGVRAFGGDPYWVGELGGAYISGVHEGSGGKVLTVAKHFPGHGASDRLPDTEVATVSKSLEELRQVEIPPFEAVTDGAPGGGGKVTDGLMTSHIRYRGFQGNLRDTTPPISLDSEAMNAVFALDGSPLGKWRRAGGLVVSDSLGVRAVRRYDDPSGLTFRHRDIARRALEAGNDVLIVSQFAAQNEWRLQRANLLDTVEFFASEYRRDPDFAKRVDAAALTVLRRKAALLPGPWIGVTSTQTAGEPAETTGEPIEANAAEDAARAAITVLRRIETESPRPGERIVVVSDDRATLACKTDACIAAASGGEEAETATLVASVIRRRFAEAGAAPEALQAVSEITFCQVATALRPVELAAAESEPECPDPGREATLGVLRAADWIVFAITDLNPTAIPHGDAVTAFLQVAGETVKARTTRIAALSFGPPYVFEPTDFHKLDVVVAAYSKVPASVEGAVDALLSSRPVGGAPPVSIEAADYDLQSMLEPDPDRVPPVRLHEPEPGRVTVVRAEVGPVLDRNGHAVPDGTQVQMVARPELGPLAAQESIPEVVFSGITRNGLSTLTLHFSTGGKYAIELRSGRASWPAGAADVPLARPTTTVASATAPAAVQEEPVASTRLRVSDLLFALMSVVVVAAAWVGAPGWGRRRPEDQVLIVLAAAAGGLAAYLVYGAAAATGRLAIGPVGMSALVGLVGAALVSATASVRARR